MFALNIRIFTFLVYTFLLLYMVVIYKLITLFKSKILNSIKYWKKKLAPDKSFSLIVIVLPLYVFICTKAAREVNLTFPTNINFTYVVTKAF